VRDRKKEPRTIPTELRELVGKDFVRRAETAAARLASVTPEALAAFAQAPEVAGGDDFEPDDL